MKKVLLSGFVAFASIAAIAQNNSIVEKGNNLPLRNYVAAPYSEQPTIFAPETQMGNIDKDGPFEFYISYAESNTTESQTGTFGGGRYQINSNYVAADSGLTSAMVSLRPYIGFSDYADIDGSYIEVDPTANGAKLRIDSLTIVMGHSNSSGQPNILVASLRASTAGNFGTLGQLYYPNNTVLWSDSIVTTSSLSPSGSAFGNNSTYVWDMAPNYLHTLSSTSHIGIRFDALLSPGDTCAITGLYMEDAGAILAPQVYNSFALFSDEPGSIFVLGVNWYMIAKVTYTSNASVEQFDANGFAIHSFMPNPANASTTISYELKTPGDVDFFITDMSGKQVRMISLKGQTVGTNNYELNTSDLAAGFYNVSMKVNNQVHTQKLSVVK